MLDAVAMYYSVLHEVLLDAVPVACEVSARLIAFIMPVAKWAIKPHPLPCQSPQT